MKSTTALLAAGVVAAGAFVGCERAEDNNAQRGGVPRGNQSGTAPRTTPGATTTTESSSGMNRETAVHQQTITAWKSQVQDLRGRVDQMKSKIDSYQGNDKDQVQQQFNQLQLQVASLDTRLQDFKPTSTTAFDDFRTTIESDLSKINNQVQDLNQKIQSGGQGQQPQQPQQPANTPPSPTMPDTTNPSTPPTNPDM